MAPGKVDRVQEALECNELIMGWGEAEGLTDEDLSYWEFREIIHQTFHPHREEYFKSGKAARNLWRLIREMKKGDLIVVPHGSNFYVAEVTEGKAYRHIDESEEDVTYRRPVVWLNGKKPIPRSWARAALQSRMNVRTTSNSAEDLVSEIEEALTLAQQEGTPSFDSDLRSSLVSAAREELIGGRMNSYGFEKLIARVLKSLGALNVRIVPRTKDVGADIVASFRIAESFQLTLAVQAKHYRPEPPVGPEAVKELLSGMEAENAQLGIVVTSGEFSQEAHDLVENAQDEKGILIQLMDGEGLAALIVESGLRAVSREEDEGNEEGGASQ